MNTPLTLHGPASPTWSQVLAWWRSLQDRVHGWRLSQPVDDDLDSLLELDAHTLDDIGAPDVLRARAHAHRDAQQHALAELRLGVSSADWRHW